MRPSASADQTGTPQSSLLSCSCLLSAVLIFLGLVPTSLNVWPDRQIVKRLLKSFSLQRKPYGPWRSHCGNFCLWIVSTVTGFPFLFSPASVLQPASENRDSWCLSSVRVASLMWSEIQSEFGSCLADSSPTPSWLFMNCDNTVATNYTQIQKSKYEWIEDSGLGNLVMFILLSSCACTTITMALVSASRGI